ncbi:MAG: ATP-binding protein [Polyangiaceae bacterium]
MKKLEQISARLFGDRNPGELFARLIACSPSPIMLLAANGDLLFVNDAFETQFGERPPEGWNLRADPICREQGMVEGFDRALRGEIVRVGAHWFRSRVRESSPRVGTEIAGFPLMDADRGALAVLVVYRDVTAEMLLREAHERAEAALRDLRAAHEALLASERERAAHEEALRESDERLRFALRASQAVAWEVDFRTKRFVVSDGADEFGMSADLTDQQRIDLIHPADRQHVHDEVVNALIGVEAPSSAYRVRPVGGGEHRWVEPRATLVRDPSGAVTGARGVTFDVTARKRAEQLELDNARMAQASRSKNELLASMSHELRTPLNSIIGFAELLHDGAVDPGSPEQKEFLADILRSASHLLGLVNDVLDLAQVEAGRLELRPEPIDLRALVAEVTAVMHPASARKNIPIEAQVDPSLADVALDPARLKQVLYNYLSNAMKFTADGGRITVRVTREDDARMRIEVEDTGIGIAADDIGHLFQESPQIQPIAPLAEEGAGVVAPLIAPLPSIARRPSGTGLGLALTRRLVEAQGGSVGVRSTPGVGSVFFAVLPRRSPPSPSRRTTGTMALHRGTPLPH